MPSLLRQAEWDAKIQGISASRNGPKVSHLLFADDHLLITSTSHQGEVLEYNSSPGHIWTSIWSKNQSWEDISIF